MIDDASDVDRSSLTRLKGGSGVVVVKLLRADEGK
jgi:hypothetical protein